MVRPKKNAVQEAKTRFKKLRLEAKLSQEEMARQIGVAVSTIRRWEKGGNEPTMTVEQMTKFCLITDSNFYKLPSKLC